MGGSASPDRRASVKEDLLMTEGLAALKLGQIVPDFELDVYDPVKGDFGTFSSAAQKGRKRWTLFFFYPADFTFV
jgi:peroxiredoxin